MSTARRDELIRDQAREQWGHDPAGSVHAGEAQLGTPEGYASIERQRYREQPWMHETFRFERYAGLRVLEIGVGLGTDHLQFARAGARITGVDLTPRCVDLTTRRLEQEGFQPDVRLMDAEALEFDDDAFDAVYSFGVLHHIPSTERAFAEVRRVLRPGGTFLGALYSRESFFHAWTLLQWGLRQRFRQPYEELLAGIEYSTGDALPHVRLFGRDELRRSLNGAGFADVTIQRRQIGMGVTERLPRLDRVLGPVGGWYLAHHAR